jgi:ribonuclease PH
VSTRSAALLAGACYKRGLSAQDLRGHGPNSARVEQGNEMGVRSSDRGPAELRELHFELGVNRYAEGSCRIRMGGTDVLCTASVDTRVPGFLVGRGEGWVTAEYGMLPRATDQRVGRERSGSRPAGRTYEIQRLIGRALRAVVDRKVLGERTITVDCDVLQADGGTRCAAITGGYVALAQALLRLDRAKSLPGYPLLDELAAVSVGIVAGEVLLDLAYEEDAAADVDVNVVRTGSGRYVEIQGTAEEEPFARERLVELLDVADRAIDVLIERQRAALGDELARLVRRRGGR